MILTRRQKEKDCFFFFVVLHPEIVGLPSLEAELYVSRKPGCNLTACAKLKPSKRPVGQFCDIH